MKLGDISSSNTFYVCESLPIHRMRLGFCITQTQNYPDLGIEDEANYVFCLLPNYSVY